MTLVNLVLDDDAPEGYVTALYQVGRHLLTVRQNPEGGRSHAEGYEKLPAEQSANPVDSAAAQGTYLSNTPNVGWLVWSSTFVLAEYLLSQPPLPPPCADTDTTAQDLGGGTLQGMPPSGQDGDAAATWEGVRVLELGAGVGALGMALAREGARVTITDLPHITPLTRENVALNFEADGHCPSVVDYQWNKEEGADLGARFDVVVAADCVYESQYYPDLLAALQTHLAPHGRAYCCYKNRRLRQDVFEAAAVFEGWELQVVEDAHLPGEYQGGEYRLLVLSHRR